MPDRADQAQQSIRRALELTRQNLDEARRSVLDLRANDVHQMSLPDAIARLLRRLSDESTIVYELSNDGLSGRLSARVEVGLYRIVEEALENARRHSRAGHVWVRIHAVGGNVSIVVDDDGTGFDPAELRRGERDDHGFGIVGIRERARLLGGSLQITSKAGHGTSVRITVPHAEDPARAFTTELVAQGEGE